MTTHASLDAARLDALADYDILDTPAETGFDDIVLLAANVCAVPIALVSLVAQDRQWFKARVGIEAHETPIEQSVCAHALGQTDILVIPDLTQDDRTRTNTLVTREAALRFYAGAPLITPAGIAIGTVCVIDTSPRPEGLSPAQRDALAALARQVIVQLELRRLLHLREASSRQERRAGAANLARAVASEEQNAVLRASEIRSRFAQEAGRVGTFELDVATNVMVVSPEFCRLFGLAVAPSYPAKIVEGCILPEDAARRSGEDTRRDGTAQLETEYRVRRADDGQVRWIARRGDFIAGPDGRPTKMFGAVQDITDQKRVQQQQSALLELGDRLKDATTSDAVVEIASACLGRTLSLSRAGYGRIDQKAERLEIDRDWTAPGAATLEGHYPVAAFKVTIDRLKRGETLAIANVPGAAWLGPEVETYAGIGTRAQIKVPLMERGDLVGLVYAHQREARTWHKDEVDFVQGVADRAYAALAKIKAEADQRTLNHELSHRLKNTLAMVQAIASQTLRAVPERAPVEAFEKRLHALSHAHDVLLQENWSAARMMAVVRSALDVFSQPHRFDVSGPDLTLGPRAALSLALVIHELATNAMKYGALSNEVGRVSLDWRVEGVAGDAELVLVWAESGGPAVQEPQTKGFGSRLIRMGLGTGGVELGYAAAGLRVEMRAPLAHLRQV